MGTQESDYWGMRTPLSKRREVDAFGRLLKQSHHRSKTALKTGGMPFLIYPLFAIAGLWFGADALLKRPMADIPINMPQISFEPSQAVKIPVLPKKPETTRPIFSGIVLKADSQGHFRGTVSINGVSMPFLIDTGATITVVPARMAYSAKLPYGRYVQARTAGGRIVERETVIRTMTLGDAEIRNLNAYTNEYVDEVLIGMNTLKYFRMIQDGRTLTLVANFPTETGTEEILPSRVNSVVPNQPIKKPVTIKKTVVCDARQICTTKYSDR